MEYHQTMAGQAQPEENQSPGQDLDVRIDRDRLRETTAKLYGQGFERAKIARMLVDHLVPNNRHRPLEQRLSQARTRLRHWEQNQEFRDMIYRLAVVKLDLQTPAILGGIAKKAKRGRVDAARLALEITGRHNPKGDQQPTQVALVIQGVSRPSSVKAVVANETDTIQIVDGEAMVDEDEDV